MRLLLILMALACLVACVRPSSLLLQPLDDRGEAGGNAQGGSSSE